MTGTCSRMSSSSRAVVVLMTRRDGGGAAAVYLPAELVVPWIRVGWIRTPPFAIVAYTSAICSAVTATPCPNDSVYRVSPYQSETGGRSPSVSFGRPMPVGWPRPNARRELACVCSLMWGATWDMPLLGGGALM